MDARFRQGRRPTGRGVGILRRTDRFSPWTGFPAPATAWRRAAKGFRFIGRKERLITSDLNDPRVFFAAERTLLAWNRTSLTLMAFGFVIERFGLFLQVLSPQHTQALQRGLSYWIGLGFILLGSTVSAVAVVQYRKILATLKPVEIPSGYAIHLGSAASLIVAGLGFALLVYLFAGSGI